MHNLIRAENDDKKRADLRRKSVTADYFISGANAIARTGEIVACDASGSRVGAWPFAAGHLILVVGVNKIVPSLNDALNRVQGVCVPAGECTGAEGVRDTERDRKMRDTCP